MDNQTGFFIYMAVAALLGCYGGFRALRKPQRFYAIGAVIWGAGASMMLTGGLAHNQFFAVVDGVVAGLAGLLFLIAAMAAKE